MRLGDGRIFAGMGAAGIGLAYLFARDCVVGAAGGGDRPSHHRNLRRRTTTVVKFLAPVDLLLKVLTISL